MKKSKEISFYNDSLHTYNNLKIYLRELQNYPFAKELETEADFIIKTNSDLFKSELEILEYKKGVFNKFYNQLFGILNFNELQYIDVSKAVNDLKYRLNCGKVISKKFFDMYPNVKKYKNILNDFFSDKWKIMNLKRGNKKFDRTKYPERIFIRANELKKRLKLSYGDCLFIALKQDEKFKDIDSTKEEFYNLNNTYKQFRHASKEK